MRHPMPARAVRACFASAGVLALAATLASAASAKTFYIAKNGNNANPCTSTKPCKTINRGVGLAKRGDTVVVSKGSYSQNVLITKDIKVTGVGNPVINALGRDNGFVVQGAGAAGATVSGFTVENAAFEGILVEKTSRVTISGNLVKNNDQGHKAAKPTGECAPAGQIPGDCGEGIHLITVSHAKVTGNTVTGNAGGIYLTDEFGPTSHNLVSHNRSLNNLLDCGITVAGHSNKAVSLLTGKPTPTTGGVFANTVIDNVVNNNGTKEAGAGILMAGGAPGTGVYDNLVEGNSASGNGHAGVALGVAMEVIGDLAKGAGEAADQAEDSGDAADPGRDDRPDSFGARLRVGGRGGHGVERIMSQGTDGGHAGSRGGSWERFCGGKYVRAGKKRPSGTGPDGGWTSELGDARRVGRLWRVRSE